MTQMLISIFFVSAGVLVLGCFFPVSILNKVAVCRPETLLKRDPDKGASREFCRISKDTFFRTTPVDCFCLQSIEFKSAFCISNLFNADYESWGRFSLPTRILENHEFCRQSSFDKRRESV